MTDSARVEHVTRNRDARAAPRPGVTMVGRGVETLLTLALLVPGAALLVARVRSLTDLQSSGAGGGCTGIDTLGPVLHAGLPAVALVMIVPAALLSLAGRARGWLWLGLALAGTVLLDLALTAWLPACL